MTKKSPLAPPSFPAMPPVAGLRLASRATGARYRGRDDLMLMEFAPATTVAGVFTRSLTASAPVDWCRRALSGGAARALIVNAGNANAFTGQAGMAAVEQTAEAGADLLGCRPSRIFVASTGVIGVPLQAAALTAHLPGLAEDLAADAWGPAAAAIMTTDTYAKGATATASIAGTRVTLNGIAKGSGMIAPDMATMLAFLATDAAIPAPVLQTLLTGINGRTFNCITVDGDTSTSDTALLFATAAAAHPPPVSADDPVLDDFKAQLETLMAGLAQQIVRDGEGASKFVTIRLSGAADDDAARRIGLCIGNSPLVKTAIAGEDANWGRIVMAVGKAGERADRDRLAITIGGVAVARDGFQVAGYDEAPVAAHMKGSDIDIAVDVGIGGGRATVWTCDLTHGYIDINADYRS